MQLESRVQPGRRCGRTHACAIPLAVHSDQLVVKQLPPTLPNKGYILKYFSRMEWVKCYPFHCSSCD